MTGTPPRVNRPVAHGRLRESTLRLVVRRAGAIVFAAGVGLGIIALGADSTAPKQNHSSEAPPVFHAQATTHVTQAAPEASADFEHGKEIATPIEVGPSEIPPSTRNGFMATWENTNGAAGYRLDVSTSASFDSYVNGYQDLDIGNATGRVVSGLKRGTTYYYRVRAYNASGTSGNSNVMAATTVAAPGLIINPTFDSSITSKPNAAAIQAAINRAIAILESLFSDRVTVSIRFRYSTTGADGTPLSSALSRSEFVYYTVPWSIYIDALIADARTSYDTIANASLPTAALSANINPSSADGRAVGLNTPPAMFANGTVGSGGPYDGIVTLNSGQPFQFSRPPSGTNFDAQRSIEHEIDEVIGLGSRLNAGGNDLRPQDLFSWSAPGTRNLTSSGARYFSINGGRTAIVSFNQNSKGDFGDWLSPACPQAHPYVQNAFGCAGQFSDVTATSPEGINLDVIGYDLADAPRAEASDINRDAKPDYLLYTPSTGQTAVWYLNNNARIGGGYGPTVPAAWALVHVADFDRDGHADYGLFNASSQQTAIWYLSGLSLGGSAYGPTLPAGWEWVATGDFNGDNKSDFVLYTPSTRQTALWFLNNNVRIGGAFGPTLPAGWRLVGVADFNRDGELDYLLFNSSTRQSAIWYLSGVTFAGGLFGPTIASGYELIGVADFNGDSKPDYLLTNPSTGQTAIWYLNNNVLAGGLYGPTLPAGWNVVAP